MLLSALALALLPLLRPDVDPLVHGVSAYANGPFGEVQTAAFVLLGIGSIAVALALLGAGIASKWLPLGAGLVVLSGFGQMLLGVFAAAPIGGPQTAKGDLHGTIGPVASVAMIAGAFALALAFRGNDQLRRLVLPSAALAAIAAAAAIATKIGQQYPDSGIPVGVAMRLLLGSLLLWGMLVAVRLRTPATPGAKVVTTVRGRDTESE